MVSDYTEVSFDSLSTLIYSSLSKPIPQEESRRAPRINVLGPIEDETATTLQMLGTDPTTQPQALLDETQEESQGPLQVPLEACYRMMAFDPPDATAR